jgi:hypothetical protein
MFLSEESLQRLIHLNKPKYDVALVEASVDERPAIYAQRGKERHALNRIIWLFPQMLHLLPTEKMPVSLADCGRFAVQAPQLVWILQSRWMLDSIHLYHPYRRTSLYQIRLLLDLSWHDIATAFSALRSFIRGETEKQVVAYAVTILALSLELYPPGCSLTSHLACDFLRLIKRIGAGGLPRFTW